MMFLSGDTIRLRIAGALPLVFFLLLMTGSCLPEGEYKMPVNYEPRVRDDGWAISDPSSEGFNTARLEEVYAMMFEEGSFLNSRSLLIVKNGKLVSESYFRDKKDIDRKNNIKGITKGFTSILAGFAWDLGLIETGARLYTYIPDYFDGDRSKRDITVEHILTMRTGLEWDDMVHTRDLFNVSRFPNSVRVVLTKPLVHGAGTEFSCNDGTPQITMGLLRHVFRLGQTDSLVNKLFSPLGISDFTWEQHTDGLHYGGTGLHLRPRDLARFGLFCLNMGQWNERQIVSRCWMKMATSPLLEPEITGHPWHYGYYWWIDQENNAYFVRGTGGHFLYIAPSFDLVIVHTANGAGKKELTTREFLYLADRIIGALEK
jgi:CubicO group peptidase (beta-lactamase class C family)